MRGRLRGLAISGLIPSGGPLASSTATQINAGKARGSLERSKALGAKPIPEEIMLIILSYFLAEPADFLVAGLVNKFWYKFSRSDDMDRIWRSACERFVDQMEELRGSMPNFNIFYKIYWNPQQAMKNFLVEKRKQELEQRLQRQQQQQKQQHQHASATTSRLLLLDPRRRRRNSIDLLADDDDDDESDSDASTTGIDIIAGDTRDAPQTNVDGGDGSADAYYMSQAAAAAAIPAPTNMRIDVSCSYFEAYVRSQKKIKTEKRRYNIINHDQRVMRNVSVLLVFVVLPLISLLCLIVATFIASLTMDIALFLKGRKTPVSESTLRQLWSTGQALAFAPLVFLSFPCYVLSVLLLHARETFGFRDGCFKFHFSIDKGICLLYTGFPMFGHAMVLSVAVKLFIFEAALPWTVVMLPTIFCLLIHLLTVLILAFPLAKKSSVNPLKLAKKKQEVSTYASVAVSCVFVFATGVSMTLLLVALKLDNFGYRFSGMNWFSAFVPLWLSLVYLIAVPTLSMCAAMSSRGAHAWEKVICAVPSVFVGPLIIFFALLAFKLDYAHHSIAVKMPYSVPFGLLVLWEILVAITGTLFGYIITKKQTVKRPSKV